MVKLPIGGGLKLLLGGKVDGTFVSGTITLVANPDCGTAVVGNKDGITIGVIEDVAVIVGVMVGVLLGGRVGVTNTNPDSTVTACCGASKTGGVEDGVLVRARVGATPVGAIVTS